MQWAAGELVKRWPGQAIPGQAARAQDRANPEAAAADRRDPPEAGASGTAAAGACIRVQFLQQRRHWTRPRPRSHQPAFDEPDAEESGPRCSSGLGSICNSSNSLSASPKSGSASLSPSCSSRRLRLRPCKRQNGSPQSAPPSSPQPQSQRRPRQKEKPQPQQRQKQR